MKTLLNKEWLPALMLALVLVGLTLLLVGAYSFVDASTRLSANTAQQVQDSGEQTTLETREQAQLLMASDIERRRLSDQRSQGMVAAGAGLICLALGWMGYDYLRTRRTKTAQAES